MPIPIKDNEPKSTRALTLVELLIGVTIIGVIVLSIYSIDTFSHRQVINSARRVRVQNELAYALEHMGKYVQLANGAKNNPGIRPIAGGFQVRVDFNPQQTPSDINDDAWVSYTLVGNTLSVSCSAVSPTGTCGTLTPEDLSSRIITGFVMNTIMPNPIPLNPGQGFYVETYPFPGDPAANSGEIDSVEVGLIGRFNNPSGTITQDGLRTNPQAGMKATLICNSCSTH